MKKSDAFFLETRKTASLSKIRDIDGERRAIRREVEREKERDRDMDRGREKQVGRESA